MGRRPRGAGPRPRRVTESPSGAPSWQPCDGDDAGGGERLELRVSGHHDTPVVLRSAGGLPTGSGQRRDEGQDAPVIDDGDFGARPQVVLLPKVGGNDDPALLRDRDGHRTSWLVIRSGENV